MAHDERVKGKEWDLTKRCPVCEDMKAGKITDDGDQVMIPGTNKPFFCPKCGHLEIRFFWRIGAVRVFSYFCYRTNPALDPSGHGRMYVL